MKTQLVGKATYDDLPRYIDTEALNELLGKTGKIVDMEYDNTTEKYKIIYTSDVTGQSYEMDVTKQGDPTVIKYDIDVSLYEKSPIYVFFYPDTGVLAFSNDGSEPDTRYRGRTAPVTWNNQEDNFIYNNLLSDKLFIEGCLSLNINKLESNEEFNYEITLYPIKKEEFNICCILLDKDKKQVYFCPSIINLKV